MKQTLFYRIAVVVLLGWIGYTQMQISRFTHQKYFPVSVQDTVTVTGEVDANVTNSVEVSGDVDATVVNSPLEIQGTVEIER